MSKRSDTDLRSAAHDKSFVPGRDDLPQLVELLLADDDADAAEKALARAGDAGARAAMARFDTARPPLRGRLVRVVARVGGHGPWLLDRLRDEDDKTRRNAIVALGKIDGSEDALIEAWGREQRVDHRRSIAASLGKVGGARALELLSGVATDDAELRRIASEAVLKLERTASREGRGAVDPAVEPESPIDVRFRCRRGLETILVEELSDLGARGTAPGVVEIRAQLPLTALFRARTALSFSFPLHGPTGDIEARIAGAIAGAVPLLRRFTRGPITYRIEWVGRGHRRAATYRVARLVAERAPELRNDPTASLWEMVIEENGGDVSVEARPKAIDDPRFTYRLADVPASSHPTIAAALAHVAGVRRDEVVWDPFVGAGAELIERARLGPYRAMYGCDVDPAAIAAATRNLEAAGHNALLVLSDARASRPPEPVSLVITNPPMGRRVLERRAIEPLFDAVLANVRASMRRDGRVVMLSPIFGRSVELATRHGFRVERRGAIDLGGFDAELQVLEVKRR
jgi:23S rRNA G2445 N2-methylase RlmL